jgi:ElaB/YqjD/DUF883 family membrane-anchored ribosome-binding protein
MDERRGEARVRKRANGAPGICLGTAAYKLMVLPSEAEGTVENLVGQAKDAVRQAADSASEYAQEAYDRGARYVRQEWDRHPEAGRYLREGRQRISHPVEENPIAAILIAGAVGSWDKWHRPRAALVRVPRHPRLTAWWWNMG